jgi:serine/threonine protein kinase
MYKFNSDHVVKLLYDLETPDNFLLAMEYCNGGDLLDFHKLRLGFTEKDAQ